MPHLSSRSKERERQGIIMALISDLVKHNKSDWTDEKIREQKSMFDKVEPATKRLWRKLAYNLLFTGNNKSLIANYKKHSLNHMETQDHL